VGDLTALFLTLRDVLELLRLTKALPRIRRLPLCRHETVVRLHDGGDETPRGHIGARAGAGLGRFGTMKVGPLPWREQIAVHLPPGDVFAGTVVGHERTGRRAIGGGVEVLDRSAEPR
jgi:hypothetical protein